MKIVRLLGLAALGMWAVPVLAQPQGRPPMGGRMRSPKMRLPRLIEGATRLNGANALSKTQAKQMLHLVSPWRSRPTMSEDAGTKLFASLSGALSASQKTALQNDRPGGGRGGGGGREGGGGGREGGGGGRMGGGGGRGPGGGGGRMGGAGADKMRAAMASFNPLYSGTPAGLASMPAPFKEGMQRQRNRLNAALSQLQQKAR